MREITPSDKQRRLRWIRSADGHIKRESDGRTIGDIWAEQRRMSLAMAIQTDKQRADKRAERSAFLSGFWVRIRRVIRLIQSTKLGWGLKLPDYTRRALVGLSRRQLWIGGGAFVLILFLLVTGVGPSLHTSDRPANDAKITTRVLAARAQKPDYQTILPQGKKIDDLGGWGRVSPPDKNPVFAYADQIAGVRITVSEQPLPDDFKSDVAGSTADLAKQFSANDVVSDGPLTFYVGTSFKGPQSVILTQKGLLVLIKSDAKISDEQWANYIKALE